MSSSAAQIGELQPPGEKRDEEHFSFNYVHFALEEQRKLGTTQNEHVLTKWEHFVLYGGGIGGIFFTDCFQTPENKKCHFQEEQHLT